MQFCEDILGVSYLKKLWNEKQFEFKTYDFEKATISYIPKRAFSSFSKMQNFKIVKLNVRHLTFLSKNAHFCLENAGPNRSKKVYSIGDKIWFRVWEYIPLKWYSISIKTNHWKQKYDISSKSHMNFLLDLFLLVWGIRSSVTRSS